MNPAFVTSDYRGHKVRMVWALSRRSVQIGTRLSCSAVRRRGTNFADPSHLQIFSQNFLARTECYSNILCNLSDRRRSARMISRTRATVSSVWEVDSLSGRGSSSKDRRPFLKREYTQMSSIDLGRTLRKLLATFRTFQHQFSPRRKQKSMHTRC